MHILLKFILKTIREKKFRTFLILISITLSTALFFASNAVSYSFAQMIVQQYKNFYGNSTIVVSAKPKAEFSWVKENMIPKDPNIEKIMGVITGSGMFKKEDTKVSFTLFGSDLELLKEFNPFELRKQQDFYPFEGKKIIVSEKFSKENKVTLGEILSLKINGTSYRFKIVGLAGPSSLFGSEMQGSFALVPKGVLESIYDAKGLSSEIFIKTTKATDAKAFIKELSSSLPRNEVREPVDEAEIQKQLSMISIPFMMISILVLIMSIFIIYTSFKVITVERLPILGTFRSIGATAKMTRKVLIWESMVYGCLGGFLGIPLGIGVLSIMVNVLSKAMPDGLKINVAFQPSNVISSFILAFFISVISSYLPIKKASKLPLKDVVLGTVEPKNKNKRFKLIFAVTLLILSIILPFVVPQNLVTPIGSIAIFTLVTSLLMSTPLFVQGLILFFENLYDKLFGNEGILAVKNLKNNDNVNQNISLLALSISTLLLVVILSGTMQSLITDIYKGAKFDALTFSPELDKSMIKQIQDVEYVDKIYPVYQANNVKIKNTAKSISQIESIDPNRGLEFFDFTIKGEKELLPMLKKLQEGRYLLVKDTILKKFEVNIGDSLILETPTGDKKYKILGEMTTYPVDALGSEDYLRSDFSLKKYGLAYVKSMNPKDFVKEAGKVYGENYHYTMTMEENKQENEKIFGMLFGILQGFAILLLVIGTFGIINNLIINFLQRRRATAMYKSVGMSQVQLRKITLIEACTAGIFGSILGIFLALLELTLVFKIMEEMLGMVPMDISIPLFILAVILAMVITLVGSIAPLVKGQKLEIIEAIKYE